MNKSAIQWTDSTLNFLRGCSRISTGCVNCYAETLAGRFCGTDKNGKTLPFFRTAINTTAGARWTGEIIFDEKTLLKPLSWKLPRRIFVNSVSDLFHHNVLDEWIDKFFAVAALTPQHQYQILTKRPERMRDYLTAPDLSLRMLQTMKNWLIGECGLNGERIRQSAFVQDDTFPLKNVWLGVSVENQQAANDRIPLLLNTPAAIRFLSCEPLLSEIDLTKYLGGNCEVEKQRRDNLSSGFDRRIADRFSGQDLEKQQTDGTRHGRILPNSQDVESEANIRAGTQIGLSPFLREDSSRFDDKPQERREKRQQTGESGIGDSFATNDSQNLRFGQDGESLQIWRDESESETDAKADCRDSHAASDGRNLSFDSAGLRCEISSNLENSAQSTVGKIDWTIVGGESGRASRSCSLEWISSIVNQCRAARVPVFVKQLGAFVTTDNLNLYDFPDPIAAEAFGDGAASARVYFADKKGGDFAEFPDNLKVRQFPK